MLDDKLKVDERVVGVLEEGAYAGMRPMRLLTPKRTPRSLYLPSRAMARHLMEARRLASGSGMPIDMKYFVSFLWETRWGLPFRSVFTLPRLSMASV